jgi:hypothetical protein
MTKLESGHELSGDAETDGHTVRLYYIISAYELFVNKTETIEIK